MDAVNLWYNKSTLNQGNKESSCQAVVVFLRTATFLLVITYFLGRGFLEVHLQLYVCEKAPVLRTRFTALPSVYMQTDSGC